MKQCTEKGDDKTRFDTAAINTYGTYDNMRDSYIHKHLPNLKAIWIKIDYIVRYIQRDQNQR